MEDLEIFLSTQNRRDIDEGIARGYEGHDNEAYGRLSLHSIHSACIYKK